MNETSTDDNNIDLSDLPFDVQRHQEALTAFTRLALKPDSVKPALRARDVVLVRFPSDKFRIGMTVDLAVQEKDYTHLEAIHETGEEAEAQEVRAEVERYFARHFPGRLLRDEPSVHLLEGAATYRVFVACYAPDNE